MRKTFDILFTTIRNIIILIVIWGSFGNSHGYLEKGLLAGIWLTFSFVFMFFTRWQHHELSKLSGKVFSFNYMRELMNDKAPLEEDKEAQKALSENAEFFSWKVLLNECTNIGVWLIVLYNVL